MTLFNHVKSRYGINKGETRELSENPTKVKKTIMFVIMAIHNNLCSETKLKTVTSIGHEEKETRSVKTEPEGD